MKKLVIQGQEFQYKVETDYGNYDGSEYYWTEFYQGTEVVTRRKYFLFGAIIEKAIPKSVFRLNFDIEDPIYTKEYVREKIEEKMKILSRKIEIENGQIV